MEERLQFVHDAFSDRVTMRELCARYGVSRRIGYKWLVRFEAEGRPGLQDRSRAPHHCPHRMAPAVANVLVAARRAHPHWGAIADHHARFLISCRGLRSTKTVTARPVFEGTVREYGLPCSIRTDNGVPFATQAIHGLSYLNVWWMRLGIVHQRIHPGCLQENGAHEGMHRTVKRQAIKPVRQRCGAQQCHFDAFRREYNTERPHEHLGQKPPASCYRPWRRPYPDRVPPLEYPGHFLVKKITTGGTFRFRHRLLSLANAMVDQPIGLEETEDGVWSIWFNTVLLATFDEHDYIMTG